MMSRSSVESENVTEATVMAYAGRPGADLAGAIAAFGLDWLYVVAPLTAFVVVLIVLARRGTTGGTTGGPVLHRAAHGAAALSGLPPWCAGPLVLTVTAFLFAVQGFFWDVAWHIDIGRDEFLFSPPHLCLLLGLGLLAVAGWSAISTATRDRADVGWHPGRWRVPFGGAALLAAGAAALVAFSVDELWHWAYGLDVTMWSPTHLTMISSAAVSPLSAWLLLGEAGPRRGHPALLRHGTAFLAAAALIGLSAWQLEFDLGVPQWQHLYHPVLVAIAAGMALTAARAALGRGGALVVVALFVVLRVLLAVLTAGVWGLSVPTFIPYAAAGAGVEMAFALARRESPVRQGAAAGLAVGTLGLGGAWAFTSVWGWHPWQVTMLPRAWPAVLAAVAAGVAGSTFGRVVAHRPSGITPWPLAAALAAIVVAVLVPLPRTAPAASATVRTQPAQEGWVDVEVVLDPSDGADGADWFEVLSWQGDGHRNTPLVAVGPGRFVSAEPVPVHGQWKSNVRLGRGAELGAIPVYLPADPEIGASEVSVAPTRTQPFRLDRDVLLREARDGPVWPAIIGYGYSGASLIATIGLLVAGCVGLERRRRSLGWRAGAGSLAGRRIVLTGAAGGIGTASRAALEAQGARVVGLDLTPDGPETPETIGVDVRDAAAVRDAVGEAVARLGGLDIMIANAGVGVAGDSTALPDPRARDVLEVNFFGAWNAVAAAAPHLLTAGGQVVVVASGLSVATVPYAAAYTASKRALAGYADVLRLEAAGRLTVTTVNPGYIPTRIHEGAAADGASLEGVVRRERVADAAAAIVTACETGRRELASTPMTTAELWLARHAPRLVDRIVRRRWAQVERTRPKPRFVQDAAALQPQEEVRTP